MNLNNAPTRIGLIITVIIKPFRESRRNRRIRNSLRIGKLLENLRYDAGFSTFGPAVPL
jgi:hypothetical protein